MYQPQELSAVLLRQNIITSEQMEAISKELGASLKGFEAYLLDHKLLDEEKLAAAKAELYHLPYKNLIDQDIKDAAVYFLNKDIAKNYKIICFYKDYKVAKIGLVDFDLKAMEAVNFLAQGQNLQIEYNLISEHSFRELFKRYERMEEEISTALDVKAKTRQEEGLSVDKEDQEEQLLQGEDVNNAPVAKIVSVIIKHAVEARASDIHVEPFANESRVRYRIDGMLHNSLVLPKSIHNSVVARIKVMARLKLDETRIPQDGRLTLVVDNRQIDFRVSTLPLTGLEKVEMRILDQAKGVTVLEDLGFSNHCYDLVKEAVKKTSGVLLLTGPTGSGKTTTLYSLINILNKESVNISTLEDPIEYQIKGVNQSQIRPELGFTFATGLRSFLRQDPNIIMVGEVRDEETAELAVHAGLTGHLVLSTLHTNDALGGIFRLLDMKIEPFLLASTLRTVIAQRLVRRLCLDCRREATFAEKIATEIISSLQELPLEMITKEVPELKSLEDIKSWKIYEAVGCDRCSRTGYQDRTAIAEIVNINEQLQDLIINHRQDLSLEKIKAGQPFISIKQAGLFKVLQGITDLNEVLRVVEIENL